MSAEPSQTPCVLGDLPPAQAIVRQAVPATLALLAKAIYNLVDTAYSGVYPAVLPADPAVQPQPGHRGIRQMASHLPGGATPPVCRAGDLRGAADVLTVLVCLFSIKPMQNIASRDLNH